MRQHPNGHNTAAFLHTPTEILTFFRRAANHLEREIDFVLLTSLDRESSGSAVHMGVQGDGHVRLVTPLGSPADLVAGLSPAENARALVIGLPAGALKTEQGRRNILVSLGAILVGVGELRAPDAGAAPLLDPRHGYWSTPIAGLLPRAELEACFVSAKARDMAGKQTSHVRIQPFSRSVLDGFSNFYGKSPAENAFRGAFLPDRADIRRHVINMSQGALSATGDFITTVEDLATIANTAADWLKGGAKRRILLYAHGGVVSEAAGIDHARRNLDWWLQNGVYPVFCVWESGAMETALQLFDATLGLSGKRGGEFSDIPDGMVESFIRLAGRPFWRTMKLSARLASAEGADSTGGLTLFICQLAAAAAVRGINPSQLPLHLLSHSAGSIMILHLLDRLAASGFRPRSNQYLAPAATMALFEDVTRREIARNPRCQTRLYILTDAAERGDNVLSLYRKSLLYLVSQGFEDDWPTPLLGMQRFLARNLDVGSMLASGFGGNARQAVILAPTDPCTPDNLSSSAATHADFDDDPATMNSVVGLIRGSDNPAALTPYPPGNEIRAPRPSLRPMELPSELVRYQSFLARLDAVAPASPPPAPTAVPNSTPAILPQQAFRFSGTKRALTIGINEYAPGKQLSGCANDAREWSRIFARLGFATVTRTAASETTRKYVLGDLTDLIGSAGPGDLLAWHYSGHGAQFVDTDGDEAADARGHDQGIVCSNRAGEEDILRHTLLDDEIGLVLDRLHPQARLFVFLDCCHSGSATRLVQARGIRSYGRIVLRRAGPPRNARNHSSPAYATANHVLFSACAPGQLATENGDPVMGIFTRKAARVLDGIGTGQNITNNEFLSMLRRSQPDMPGQDCQIYARAAEFDAPFLTAYL